MSTAPLGAVMLAIATLWICASPQPLRAFALDLVPHYSLRNPGSEPIVHVITVSRSGELAWDDGPLVDRSALEARLDAIVSPDVEGRHEVVVDPKAGSEYGAVLSVLTAIQRSGLKEMGIVVENHGGRLELLRASSPLPKVPAE